MSVGILYERRNVALKASKCQKKLPQLAKVPIECCFEVQLSVAIIEKLFESYILKLSVYRL
jgi:hypothetical protein